MSRLSKQVVNIKQCHHYDAYIGRGSKWGNPFKIGQHGNREEVIQLYEDYIRGHKELMKSLHELEHKILGCWCRPKPCHGDVLLKLLNERYMEKFF